MSDGKPKSKPAQDQRLVMWRADTAPWKAVEVECPDGLWPNSDADGETIFENTHFETQAEAEKHLRAEAKAGLKNTAARLDDARIAVTELEKRVGDWAIIWHTLTDAR